MLREVIEEYGLTGDDILHKLKKKSTDGSLNFNQFKENILKIDPSLNQL